MAGKGIEIFAPGMWENEEGPKGWWAIADSKGIFAYTSDEQTALMVAHLASEHERS